MRMCHVTAQVLFLDSDNVLVQDPSSLFDSAQFAETGALLWPDYWDTSTAPDLAAVLALPPGMRLPAGSFESGQMLFDKRRCGSIHPVPQNIHFPRVKGTSQTPDLFLYLCLGFVYICIWDMFIPETSNLAGIRPHLTTFPDPAHVDVVRPGSGGGCCWQHL